jgi:hypothetical protein
MSMEPLRKIEVYPGVWVSSLFYYQNGPLLPSEAWGVLHAAKEPYHRQFIKYKGRGAPKDHPDYLFARRGDRLALNLLDADDAAYIPDAVLDAGIAFIDEMVDKGKDVLIHCNMGVSRAPSLALLWWIAKGNAPSSAEEMLGAFREKYPAYMPNGGMAWHVQKRWEKASETHNREVG